MESNLLKVAALAAAVSGILSGPAFAQQPHEISYGLPSKSLVAAGPRIADELGLFEKHDLKPKFSYIDSTSGTATALLSKSVEFAETGVTEVITAHARGQKLVILASHYNGAPGSLVLSKAVVDTLNVSPNAPISERLKALDGLSIASTSPVSNMTIAYKGAANTVGAKPQFSYMAVAAMGAALQSGAVHGMIVTAPFWAFPVVQGSGVLWLSPSKGGLSIEYMPSSGAITATTREFADANPNLVKKVSAVFDDLSTAVAERPADVKAAIATLFPELEASTLDLVFAMEADAFQAKQLTEKDIVHDIELLRRSGTNTGPIDKVDPATALLKR
jgi:ABC-type nitrate/sulfonate/bicarbonate transport system substrate-binding protein